MNNFEIRSNRKTGRIFILSLIILLIVSFLLLTWLSLKNKETLQIRSEFNDKLTLYSARSAINILLFELKEKSEEYRWQDNWIIAGKDFTYIDTDGTKFTSSISYNAKTDNLLITSQGLVNKDISIK
ncbi:MAG: hypothetical protein ACD_79C00993G0004 [uncultured bacterium]|nr:MAG: hypothetical protein ACD_79C00993G0004 [uncultured bacterium]